MHGYRVTRVNKDVISQTRYYKRLDHLIWEDHENEYKTLQVCYVRTGTLRQDKSRVGGDNRQDSGYLRGPRTYQNYEELTLIGCTETLVEMKADIACSDHW